MTEKERKAAELAAQAEAMQQEAITSIDGKLTTVRVVQQPQPCVIASDGGAPSASGKQGDVQIGGSTATVPIKDADRVIAGLRPKLRQCYEKGLEKNPSLSGKVTFTIQVGPNGDVSSVSPKEVGLSADVVMCMKNAAMRAAFDAPGGGGSTLTVPVTCVRSK